MSVSLSVAAIGPCRRAIVCCHEESRSSVLADQLLFRERGKSVTKVRHYNIDYIRLLTVHLKRVPNASSLRCFWPHLCELASQSLIEEN